MSGVQDYEVRGYCIDVSGDHRWCPQLLKGIVLVCVVNVLHAYCTYSVYEEY